MFPEFKPIFLAVANMQTKILGYLSDKYGESYYWLVHKIYQIVETRKELNVSFKDFDYLSGIKNYYYG